MSTVCIAKVNGDDIYGATRFCFDKIVSAKLLSGVHKVLLKPNFLNSSPAWLGITTDIRLVASMIKILHECGIKEIVVGESAISGTDDVFEKLGVYRLEKLGAKVVNFDKGKWVKVETNNKIVRHRIVLGKFHLPEEVMESDLVISVAKLKTHSETMVSLSIKNLFGCVPHSDRRIAHRDGLNSALVDIFTYLNAHKKMLYFIDGIYGLEGRLGPVHGRPVKMDLIIGGTDGVAVDSTGVEVMGYKPNKVEHIRLAALITRYSSLSTVYEGVSVKDVKKCFDMPFPFSPVVTQLPVINKKIFRKKPYLRFRGRCIRCGVCVEMCPRDCIRLQNGGPKIDLKRCIGCLCCCESCEQGAMDYTVTYGFIYKMLKNTLEILHSKNA
ncbi:MAG: DUF362 domain-containing protein [bacterium]|nr:DUF362 domain-containing protein [bacterium]